MSDFEVTKQELEKLRVQNKMLKKKLMEEEGSLGASALDESNYNEDDQQTNEINDTLGDNSVIMKPGSKKKKNNLVSVGVSRPDSLLSLAEGFNQKIEELIEEKSKSIVNMIQRGQIGQFNKYQHPYSLNYNVPQTKHGQPTQPNIQQNPY